MKKLLYATVVFMLIISLCSCGEDSKMQTAKHTYSMLGFSVSYKYPNGFMSVSSDDDPTVLIYPDGSENNLDWSVMLNVWDMDTEAFKDYKNSAPQTATTTSEKDGILIYTFEKPSKQTVLMKTLGSERVLRVITSNDFDVNNALKIAESFAIDVWGEDIR